MSPGPETLKERRAIPLRNPEEARRRESRRRVLLVVASIITNLIGILIVAALLILEIVPLPDIPDRSKAVAESAALGGVVFLFSVTFGNWFMTRRLDRARRWAREGRVPSEREIKALLRGPIFLFMAQSSLWIAGALVVAVFNAKYSLDTAVRIGNTIALAGITTCALGYLTSERIIRPLAAIGLAHQPLSKPALPGVTSRSFLFWLLSSGVSFAGLVMIALSSLVDNDFTRSELSIAILGICGAGGLAGMYGAIMSGRSTAAPIISVRKALAEVESGKFDTEIEVYDGTELGMLQAGFNRMAAGLRDRERIREIFGRQVGEDVAQAALSGEIEMGGETRDVAVLFVDMVGSTQIAENRPPSEVVELLNQFFGAVVEIVDNHGGWVNKFEGDAALAIFGAPTPIDDKEGCALAAARALANHLATAVEGYTAGIGVASGAVVAGNIGDPSRYEYTVIGDPVNTAARLTELSKLRGGVLATATTVSSARPKESAMWEDAGSELLRGRTAETKLAAPRASS